MRTNGPSRLTPAERVIMRHYVDGLSRERIAAKMVLSCHTVAMHLRNAKLKLGANNMAQAGARYADAIRGDGEGPSETCDA